MDPTSIHDFIKQLLLWDIERIAALLTGIVLGVVFGLSFTRGRVQRLIKKNERLEDESEQIKRQNERLRRDLDGLEEERRQLEQERDELRTQLEGRPGDGLAGEDSTTRIVDPPPPVNGMAGLIQHLAVEYANGRRNYERRYLKLWERPGDGPTPVYIISGERGQATHRVLLPEGDNKRVDKDSLSALPAGLSDYFEVLAGIRRCGISNPADPADVLFDRLLTEQHLISFVKAYETLVGTKPRPWVTHQHSPQIIQAALRSAPRNVGGHSLQLDALIVSQDRREPPPQHFAGKSYTVDQWKLLFSGWTLERVMNFSPEVDVG